ncbi:MAG: OsmC family peroxiredoxin [Bdellovibrionales bacterium GWB1_55_8]|nr:MAG: OsmC family peroxiredoxin [Bdellovibrionales bacterium GWB1_55_8]
MKRSASARWLGSLKDGSGKLTSTSGVLSDIPYSFKTRFENEPGTNPEELIAAAHAGCFSMALAGELTKAGYSPEEIFSKNTATLDQADGKWSITEFHLEVTAKVAGISRDEFQNIALAAKEGCPVSRVLRANVTLEAKLSTEAPSKKSA